MKPIWEQFSRTDLMSALVLFLAHEPLLSDYEDDFGDFFELDLYDPFTIAGHIQLLLDEEIETFEDIAKSAVVIDEFSQFRNAELLDMQLIYRVGSFGDALYLGDEYKHWDEAEMKSS